MVTADLQSAELHVLNHCAVSPPRKEIDFFPSIPVWVTLVSVYFFAHYIHKHTLTPCHAVPIYPNAWPPWPQVSGSLSSPENTSKHSGWQLLDRQEKRHHRLYLLLGLSPLLSVRYQHELITKSTLTQCCVIFFIFLGCWRIFALVFSLLQLLPWMMTTTQKASLCLRYRNLLLFFTKFTCLFWPRKRRKVALTHPTNRCGFFRISLHQAGTKIVASLKL